MKTNAKMVTLCLLRTRELGIQFVEFEVNFLLLKYVFNKLNSV